jgi:hypothetical protein
VWIPIVMWSPRTSTIRKRIQVDSSAIPEPSEILLILNAKYLTIYNAYFMLVIGEATASQLLCLKRS